MFGYVTAPLTNIFGGFGCLVLMWCVADTIPVTFGAREYFPRFGGSQLAPSQPISHVSIYMVIATYSDAVVDIRALLLRCHCTSGV